MAEKKAAKAPAPQSPYELLAAPMPKEAVERAPRSVTRKAYDMTGFGYQFVVDRMNAVLGIDGWSMDFQILKEEQGSWAKGRGFWDISVKIVITVGAVSRSCAGGHRSESHADALKGAITNGLKKTAALFGPGADAYRGTIDEDYRAPGAPGGPPPGDPADPGGPGPSSGDEGQRGESGGSQPLRSKEVAREKVRTAWKALEAAGGDPRRELGDRVPDRMSIKELEDFAEVLRGLAVDLEKQDNRLASDFGNLF